MRRHTLNDVAFQTDPIDRAQKRRVPGLVDHQTHPPLNSAAVAELRDRLKRRVERPDSTDDVDLDEATRVLVVLAEDEHTADSIDALNQLAKNRLTAAQPAEALHAVLHAVPLAERLDQPLLLCAARLLEGLALSDLGRYAEAAVAQMRQLSLARDLGETKKEVEAIVNFGTLCGAMGQWKVAIEYFRRGRELGEEHGFADVELIARYNLADCAVQLREPASGLRALSRFDPAALQSRQGAVLSALGHSTRSRLHMLLDDLPAARHHAEEAVRLARAAQAESVTHSVEAVMGLVNVASGFVESGLLAVDRGLEFARRVDHKGLADHLGISIDAYEAAGYPDAALAHLQELVAWKRRSIDNAVSPIQYEGLADAARFRAEVSLYDGHLLARAHSLQSSTGERIERLVETAINAEIASGHDLYRTFRLSKLAKCLAAAVGWHDPRIAPLALGARLCNIGMMAIPARVLLKGTGLSAGEQHVVHDHTRYGAELLRKSKLRILDVASVIAEQHHERFDGSGYPIGLAGDAITEEARIVAVCDAFDAMTHRRPWRVKPLSIQAALNEVTQGAGAQFDPVLANAFAEMIRCEFWKHDDFDAFLAEGATELEYVRARLRMEASLA